MQLSVERFAAACDDFGLTISTKKTEVLYQPAPGSSTTEPSIFINDQKINTVDRFTYLCSTLTDNAVIDREVSNRIAKASASLCRLHANVWSKRGIKIGTKLKVYRAVVLPTLLYACETWTVYQRHAKKLNHFHTTCLRKLFNIKWQDKIPDTEVLRRADLPSIYTILMQSQLRWAGHVARMPDHRLPKQPFYGELVKSKRSRGAPKKRFKDTLKSSLKAFKLDLDSWETLAQDRGKWRSEVHKGAKISEKRHIATAQAKRTARKAKNPSTSRSQLHCHICQRAFAAQIGLTSHMRTHKQTTAS